MAPSNPSSDLRCAICTKTWDEHKAVATHEFKHDPRPRYTCVANGCPSKHVSKHEVCTVSSKQRVSISVEGSELMMELFNRMPVESLKAVPEPIQKRIGQFMVDNGYRFVFDRWFLQADPKAPERSADETISVTEAEELLRAWADLLPPNGNLYWAQVEKAREYFKKRTAVEPTGDGGNNT